MRVLIDPVVQLVRLRRKIGTVTWTRFNGQRGIQRKINDVDETIPKSITAYQAQARRFA